MRKVFNSQFRVSQEFGVNKDYYSKFKLNGHEGIDLVPTGVVRDVFCLEDGIVVLDDDVVGSVSADPYGKIVTVWHNKLNKATMYCHLAENYVTQGQIVKRGDKIGLMGGTGNVQGDHLHLNLFETDSSGTRLNRDNGFLGGIDPLPFLNEDVTPENITQVEELKKQLEQEIKNKNETYQELIETRQQRNGFQEQVKALQEQYNGLADLLQVTNDPAVIRGKVAELINQEDTIMKQSKRIVDLTGDLNNARLEVIPLKEQVGKLTIENADIRSEYDKLGKDYDDCVVSRQFKQFFRIGSIYLCYKVG